MENEKFEIMLTKKQRDVLVKYRNEFNDEDLSRLVSLAVQTPNGFEFYPTYEQLDGLISCICEICNESDDIDDSDLDELEELLGYLEGFLSDDGDISEDTGKVYILKVKLSDDGKIWRKIAIREDQTLNVLHEEIFEAFDRYEEHMYCFYMPHKPQTKLNVRTLRRNSDHYVHPYHYEDGGYAEPNLHNAAETRIGDLNLTEKQQFFYLFDYGDEWWHEIVVEKVGAEPDEDKYPRIIASQGKSPDQYGSMDEDDLGESDDE